MDPPKVFFSSKSKTFGLGQTIWADKFWGIFGQTKAELLQLNQTQFPSLGIFVSKKVGNLKN